MNVDEKGEKGKLICYKQATRRNLHQVANESMARGEKELEYIVKGNG